LPLLSSSSNGTASSRGRLHFDQGQRLLDARAPRAPRRRLWLGQPVLPELERLGVDPELAGVLLRRQPAVLPALNSLAPLLATGPHLASSLRTL
jgi:hypothetical protein